MKLSAIKSLTIKTTCHSLSSTAPPSLPIHSNSSNFISISSNTGKRVLCSSSADNGTQSSSFQGAESFLRRALASMEIVYLNRNPTAKAILELVRTHDDAQICYDHLAFRTFGVKGYGIESMASFFLDFGYTQREELRFPTKKLKAFWFSPPSVPFPEGGSGVNGPLPRIFISELLVDELSPQAQEIVKKYTGGNGKHAALASALGSLTWEKPLYSDFQQFARCTYCFKARVISKEIGKKLNRLLFLVKRLETSLLMFRESEYAAWTLVNGYAVNHVTISTHRLKSHLKTIKSFNQFIQENRFRLNSEGGVLKVSPDGLLLQSSTIADSISYDFGDNVTESVPCSYIEFAERLVLPKYRALPDDEVEEFHRRDEFEVGNADKIFESTSKEQLTRRAA